MSNNMIETEIVKIFIIKSRQERSIYELNNPKCRRNFILGRIERFVDNKRILCSIKATNGISDIVDEVRKHTSEKRCYVMSVTEHNQQIVDFSIAIDEVYCQGTALLYFPQSKLLYYEGEPYPSKTPRMLLK